MEAHPAESVEYTLSLEIHRKRIIEKGRIKEGLYLGYSDHKDRARARLSIGAI